MNTSMQKHRDQEMTKNFEITAGNIMMYFENGTQEKKDILNKCRNIISDYGKEMSRLAQHEEIRKKFLKSHHKKQEDVQATVRKFKKALNVIDPSTDPSVKHRLDQFDELVNNLTEGENDTNDNSDDDLAIRGPTMNTIDPISKKIIVDPVKNTICGHTYDRESITALIKINPKTRCPVMGCDNTEYICLKNLQTNTTMKLFLEMQCKKANNKN